MKLCVLFPGIGYHCDKPLLYFSARLAENSGYDTVIRLKFTGLDKCEDATENAFLQSVEQLGEVDFEKYDEIVFIGKSIGTIVCQRYKSEKRTKAKCVLLTPLEKTFAFPTDDSIVFHGTGDPLAKTDDIVSLCEKNGIPLYTYENANHSLEVREVFTDLKVLDEVMTKIKVFIG